MTPEESRLFLDQTLDEAPEAAELIRGAISGTFRLRPQFLRKQPRERQAKWMRTALGRSASTSIAEEVLAAYFLEHHLDLLTELLGALGVEHEEGRLKLESPPSPDKAKLQKVVKSFRKGKGEDGARRKLLLAAFAAQSAIDWPDLEALL